MTPQEQRREELTAKPNGELADLVLSLEDRLDRVLDGITAVADRLNADTDRIARELEADKETR
ncbi:hypothetical protein [Nocardiopsis sp. TNDT3]|uniref:hypothetical protein n=1 Tax=Nocardiopsis sp. TNDT3 TaxID=2249354 RepID=UPI000E3DEDAF|nr:hypothetical protein [Nocardiopsis sp. TNDT3]